MFSVLTEIEESLTPLEMLEKALEIFSPDNRIKIFSASRQAVRDILPHDTKEHLDERLQENYIESMKQLDEIHAKSKEVVFALDDTHEFTRSKYLNDQYSFAVIGQNNTWKRAFTYSAIYDCTHQLFVSNTHHNYHKSKHEFGNLQDFIRQIQHSCRAVEAAGSTVKFIDADRGYYDAELYAAAYFKELGILCKRNPEVVVIVPKKFTKDKASKKRAYLDDPNSLQVEMSSIGLFKYTHPALIENCKAINLKLEDGYYLIPVVQVAMVDEYSKKNNRTLSELKAEWCRNKINLSKSQVRLKNMQDFHFKLQIKANIKNPKRISKLSQRPRTHFKNSTLKSQYFAIRKTMEYIKWLKKCQTKMLNSLMFFTISISEDTRIPINPKKYIELAKVYHERWGIENGFKEEKAKFIRKCRSRKSTVRQLNLLFGMILYNSWHVERMNKMLKIERKEAWNKVPWDPRHPYLRRKFEQKHGHVLKAESYLLQLMASGLKNRLKSIFKTD